MHVTTTRLLIVLALLAVGAAPLLLVRALDWWTGGALLLGAVAAWSVLRRPGPPERHEDVDRIEQVDEARVRELVRGTSLRLREMRYRYSVRFDAAGRQSFTARVNQVRLGFVPVVILDAETDKQGLGWVAFVHDGHRWRGPGLPCAGSRTDALAHAAKCVEPLSSVEDTHIEE